MYRLSDLKDLTKSPPVELALKRMYRRKGRAQKQATPLTREVLEELLAVCGESNRKMRDQVLLRLGYETMRRVRAEERFSKLPIIALTAKAMKGDAEKCFAVGANDYLAKPVDEERLLSMMRVWLYS